MIWQIIYGLEKNNYQFILLKKGKMDTAKIIQHNNFLLIMIQLKELYRYPNNKDQRNKELMTCING